MNVYIRLDGWTLAVVASFSLFAIWRKDWTNLALLWSVFFIAAMIHQLVK
jgi:hypothetical protein